MAGEELVAKYQTLIFLAGSASAEFFADMALSPFEAVKVGSSSRERYSQGLSSNDRVGLLNEAHLLISHKHICADYVTGQIAQQKAWNSMWIANSSVGILTKWCYTP